jgi:c-di-AMP phosphodiesterase-like protein
METMGGGGHLSNAATQISGKQVSEVEQELVAILHGDDESEENEEE